MVIYRNSNTDPFFNLASEQYLLDTKDGDIFMLWRNAPSVIIGKNQNAYAELDIDYVEKNNIKVVRRLTGGGAVFHDTGNVNFSFITSDKEESALDFAKFTAPIIKALSSMGLENVSLSGRNDIMAGDFKISGNAQSSYNGKILHHGTLLYSADLSTLAKALTVDPEKIKAKGIKSVRNRVGNIKELMSTDMDVIEFMSRIEDCISEETSSIPQEFTCEDKQNIQALADAKYSTWEWNYGKSKEYTAEKKRRYCFGGVSVKLSVDNGIIKDVKIFGDFFGSDDIKEIEDSLVGIKYNRIGIESALDAKKLGRCISGMEISDMTELLLS